jgi:hypothetical protein
MFHEDASTLVQYEIHVLPPRPQRVHSSRWSVDFVLSGESVVSMNIRNASCDRRERCGYQQQSHARPCTRFPLLEMPRTVAAVSSRELRSNHTHICCNPAAQTYRLAPTRMLSFTFSEIDMLSSACGIMFMSKRQPRIVMGSPY